MVYSDFSLQKVIDKFELKLIEKFLFTTSIKDNLISESKLLKTLISRGLGSPLNSEKARGDFWFIQF